jgi:hypothetical protein
MNSRFDSDSAPQMVAASQPPHGGRPHPAYADASRQRPAAKPLRTPIPERNSVDPLRATDRYRLVMPLAPRL